MTGTGRSQAGYGRKFPQDGEQSKVLHAKTLLGMLDQRASCQITGIYAYGKLNCLCWLAH